MEQTSKTDEPAVGRAAAGYAYPEHDLGGNCRTCGTPYESRTWCPECRPLADEVRAPWRTWIVILSANRPDATCEGYAQDISVRDEDDNPRGTFYWDAGWDGFHCVVMEREVTARSEFEAYAKFQKWRREGRPDHYLSMWCA